MFGMQRPAEVFAIVLVWLGETVEDIENVKPQIAEAYEKIK